MPNAQWVSSLTPKTLTSSLGKAVANRTILRPGETWQDVATRVAAGNSALLGDKHPTHQIKEYEELKALISSGAVLMSGRHLQHGDETQPQRNMEVFTNCSTASASYILFYLLLNGSGVGRAYDDDMMLVDWRNLPRIIIALSADHPDYEAKWPTPEFAKEDNPKATVFVVPDTREGWAEAVEIMEVKAFEGTHRDEVLILDFSGVRAKGQPIGGMQNRPASGPIPLMEAVENVATVRDQDWQPWKQTMYVDHYLAECVLVGGARRAARIATKDWNDEEILDYVNIKQEGGLWSANNSVAVDEEFWKQSDVRSQEVLNAILEASYYHNTGEPGFINQHKLVQNNEGYDGYLDGEYAQSAKYQPHAETKQLLRALAKTAGKKRYSQITNPCGEITLNMLGGYCVIADVVPYFTPSLEVAEHAVRAVARALIRVNSFMDSLYARETRRTNRIGVGLTGIHEWAWSMFGYGFLDLIDEEKSKDFWMALSRLKRAVVHESELYAKFLGVGTPHTNTTIKPAGTTSKLFALSEGAHLPAMREYLRWVQFRSDDPLVKTYEELGYPIKHLKSYKGTTAVGFPTQPEICKLGMGEKLLTAGEATPEQQYQYLRLLEKYWIRGVDETGNPLEVDTGNQVSYTLKYNPKVVSFEEYKRMITENQGTIRCASVMPQVDATAYEYQPEEPVSPGKFIALVEAIDNEEVDESISLDHLQCQSGACPI